MLRLKWIPLAAVSAVFAAIAAVLVLQGDGSIPAKAQVPSKSCSNDFGEVGLGASFDGLSPKRFRQCDPPMATLTTNAPTPPMRRNLVTQMYGTCKPEKGATGCAPPLEVQTWPACERNLSLYRRYPGPNGEVIPYERTTVRGVPAAVFEDGTRIEVYTADVTVVIFADSAERARRAASSLGGQVGSLRVDAQQALPQPVPGALTGELSC